MEPLPPQTTRLLARLAVGLSVLAGLGMLAAFVLGMAREGAVRWPLLALAALFLAVPLVARQALR